MTEASKRMWEIVSGIFSSIVTVIGILIGVWQFNIQSNNNAKEEFNRTVWAEQRKTYTEISILIGKICSNQLPDSINSYRRAFEGLYWGSLSFVEDSNILYQSVIFREKLSNYNVNEVDENGLNELKENGYLLVQKLSISSENTWKKLNNE